MAEDRQIAQARAALKKYGSIRQAALALGLHHTTLVGRLAAWRAAGVVGLPEPKKPAPPAAEKPAPAPPKSLDERVEESRVVLLNRQLSARLAETETSLVEHKAVVRQLLGLRDDPPKPPAWTGNRHTSAEAAGVPMFVWSDWHLGETVDPRQVYGVNTYNEAVADERIDRLVGRCKFLATEHRRNAKAEGAVIILGGDFVSGWQHDELIATDYCTPLQAMRTAISRLTWALERMRETFGSVLVVCVAGNHGRLARKPTAKISMYSAYDFLIYGVLQDTLGNKSGYQFVVPAENNHRLTIGRTRYLIQHGHELGVKGGDGLIGAIGPMMRGRQKAGRSHSSLGREFDVLVIGHFHQHLWLPGQGLIVNNSLKGFDEYCRMQNYVATTPSQTMWWEHPHLGPTAALEVFVADPINHHPSIPGALAA